MSDRACQFPPPTGRSVTVGPIAGSRLYGRRAEFGQMGRSYPRRLELHPHALLADIGAGASYISDDVPSADLEGEPECRRSWAWSATGATAAAMAIPPGATIR
jgi:hypothetical protein